MTDAPQVLRVQDPDKAESAIIKPLHENLPQPPACVLMVSPVKTGKSTIISNLLLNDNFYGQDYFDEVNIISNTIANDTTSRFLMKAFDCQDHYDDSMIDSIVERQRKLKKEEQPSMAVILDDVLGSLKREAKVNHLASRFRHYNIQLLLISSQNYRKVSPVIRQNATNVIIGSPFPNQKELGKISEEFGDMFGGPRNFMKIYKIATPERYNFLHLDLQENPPKAYKNFETLVAIGDKIVHGDLEIKVDENKMEDNSKEDDTNEKKA
jgi:hypothetical protein